MFASGDIICRESLQLGVRRHGRIQEARHMSDLRMHVISPDVRDNVRWHAIILGSM